MTLTDAPDAAGEPYPGLRSFHRDETHIFFGRENTIAEMVDRLGQHHFLAVTGLSGSGKSSLVRTGLLNALERGLLVDAGSDWRIADFRPGGWPLSPLVFALMQALGMKVPGDEIGLIEAKLARGPMGLVEWLDEIDFPRELNLLLLVDQFEEIFRYRQGATGDDVNAFVALLQASAKQRKRRIYVVITMRSDYLGDCARFADLAETINDGQFLTPQLTREQCREAIEGPAAVYDGKVEPALVTRMLNDMAGNPDQLPLMQHILMLMWNEAAEREPGRPPQLTLADYEKLGGIGSSDQDNDVPIGGKRVPLILRLMGAGARRRQSAAEEAPVHRSNGALSDHADEVLAALTPAQQRLAAIMFRALTQGEGTGGRDVRRPTKLKDLAVIAGVEPADLMPVIEAFRAPGRNFLTPPYPARIDQGTDIDITHESLIRQWAKLRQWVYEEYQSAEEYRGIERAAKHWRDGRGSLLMKVDLAVAKKWRTTEHPNAAWAARYGDAFPLAIQFLQKSQWAQRRRRVLTFGLPVLGLCILVYLNIFLALALPYIDPAGEFTDYFVSPQSVLQNGSVATNTPTTIPGGRVISTLALKAALKSGKIDGAPFKIFDMLNGSNVAPIGGATKQYQYAAEGGNFTDSIEQRFATDLTTLTGGNLSMPLVFYCAGSQCWESYNAALRAIYLGYKNVYWYRGGVWAWYKVNEAIDLRAVDLVELPVGSALSTAGSRASNFFFYGFLPMFGYEPRYREASGNQQISNAAADYIRLGEGMTRGSKPDYARATVAYSKAIALDSKNRQAYYDRGLAYAHAGDLDDAIVDFNKSIALGNDDADLFFNLAESYRQKRDYGSAVKEYSAAIARNPKSVLSFAGRGDAYFNQGDYDNALTDYDQALRLNPRSSDYLNKRGNVFFSHALALSGRGPAFTETAKEQFAKSIKDYTQAIGLDPKEDFLYSNRGNAYLALSGFDGIDKSSVLDNASKDYAQAIKLNSRSAASYYGKGQIARFRADYAEAVEDYTQSIKFVSKDARVFFGRAEAYRQKGDYQHAIEDYGQAIDLNSRYAAAYYGRGKAYFAEAQYEAAAVSLVNAVAIDPANAGYFADLGFAYLYGGKPGSAADDFAEAVKHSGHPYYAIWLHMARTRAGQNDVSELASNAQKMDHEKWPWPVVALFLSTATPDSVLTAAQSAADANTKTDQMCEAEFYVGFYDAVKGDRDAARPLLQSAVKSCPRDFYESGLASLELARLY